MQLVKIGDVYVNPERITYIYESPYAVGETNIYFSGDSSIEVHVPIKEVVYTLTTVSSQLLTEGV